MREKGKKKGKVSAYFANGRPTYRNISPAPSDPLVGDQEVRRKTRKLTARLIFSRFSNLFILNKLGRKGRSLVGASGFEPPTSWSRTRGPRTFNDLATLPTIAKSCAKLLVFKDFQAFPKRAITTAGNASMRGVGTKIGTVLSRDFQSLCRAYIRDFRPKWQLHHLQNQPLRGSIELRDGFRTWLPLGAGGAATVCTIP